MNPTRSSRRSATPILQQFGLGPSHRIVTPDDFAVAARQTGCGPQRRRPLNPEVVSRLQSLRAHTPAGILKEVHAQLSLSNLVAWLMTEAVEGADDPPLDLSLLTALSQVKSALLFPALTHPTPPRLEAWHRRLLDHIRTARLWKPARRHRRAAPDLP